jgi:hypothetical protein
MSRPASRPSPSFGPAAAGERPAQRVGVRQLAQVVHAVQGLAGDVEPPGRRTGGEQQLVVALRAALEDHRVRRPLDRRDADAGAQVDRVLRVPLGGVDEGRLPRLLAEQVVLGQRRALVGHLGLVAEQHNVAGEALGAQRLRGFGAGQAAAHDHECRHASLQWITLAADARP